MSKKRVFKYTKMLSWLRAGKYVSEVGGPLEDNPAFKELVRMAREERYQAGCPNWGRKFDNRNGPCKRPECEWCAEFIYGKEPC